MPTLAARAVVATGVSPTISARSARDAERVEREREHLGVGLLDAVLEREHVRCRRSGRGRGGGSGRGCRSGCRSPPRSPCRLARTAAITGAASGNGVGRVGMRRRAPRSRARGRRRDRPRETTRGSPRGAPRATCRTGRARPRSRARASSDRRAARGSPAISSSVSVRPMLAAEFRTHVGVVLVVEERAAEVEEHRVERLDHGVGCDAAPREQLVGRHRVHDAIGGHAARGGAVGAVGLPLELLGRVRVGADRDPQAGLDRLGEDPLAAGRAARAGS